tara:strand:+ start:3180 stop:3386 length:207 start_codon:yes stop_codon:yes gene_type:complete
MEDNMYDKDTVLQHQINSLIGEIKTRIDELEKNGWKVNALLDVNIEKVTTQKKSLTGSTLNHRLDLSE